MAMLPIESDRVTVGGAHCILYYPEYAEVSRARAFMAELEDRDCLISLMRQCEGQPSVLIGAETGIPAFSDCSVITAPYRVGHGHTGAIGIIGPTRMPYAHMTELMTLLGEALSEMLS